MDAGYVRQAINELRLLQPSGAWGGTFSGNWNNALNNMGSNGNFWSSTVNSTGNAHNLNFNSSNVNPGNNANNNYNGFAVRCVLP